MADEHREFEQLAVEHVLGGLDATVSSRFRDHLIDCADCRRRVAELRGIAAELDVAAREERAAVRIKTETALQQEDSADEHAPDGWVPSRLRNLLLLAMAVLLAVISFWNIHLRQVEAVLTQALALRAEVLDVLVDGEVVPLVTSSPGLAADIAVTSDAVAVNARGVPALRTDERLVLWGLLPRQQGQPDDWRVLAVGDSVVDGRVILLGELAAHIELQLTVETYPVGIEPVSAPLFTANLP